MYDATFCFIFIQNRHEFVYKMQEQQNEHKQNRELISVDLTELAMQ